MKEQTIEQVIASSEVIGAILRFGHDVNLNKKSATDRETATEIGFRIYSEGPVAISEALTEIREASQARAVQAGPLAIYGGLFDWLDRRAKQIDPGLIKDILLEHTIRHSAVGKGEKILGCRQCRVPIQSSPNGNVSSAPS